MKYILLLLLLSCGDDQEYKGSKEQIDTTSIYTGEGSDVPEGLIYYDDTTDIEYLINYNELLQQEYTFKCTSDDHWQTRHCSLIKVIEKGE